MEPSSKTFEEMGRLTTAWSYLESTTEYTIWGMLGLTAELGPVVTWRLDLHQRWQLIMERAPEKHDAQAVQELKQIGQHLSTLTRDRNIIMKGVVHAKVSLPDNGEPKGYGRTLANAGDPLPFLVQPCWTIYRGGSKAKNYPISDHAVAIVRENVQLIASRIVDFNVRHGYKTATMPVEDVEGNWPVSLS